LRPFSIRALAARIVSTHSIPPSFLSVAAERTPKVSARIHASVIASRGGVLATHD
jgi:hypothetical protein